MAQRNKRKSKAYKERKNAAKSTLAFDSKNIYTSLSIAAAPT